MRETKLIQRLKDPALDADGKPLWKTCNLFTFGASGTGGFSKEALELLADKWKFDYMGSAHFEWGEVPRALHTIANYIADGKFETGFISYGKGLGDNLFYICEKELKTEVEQIMNQIYKNEKDLNLYEPAYLRQRCDGEKFAQRFQGWIELDNGFIFFKSAEMYAKTALMFQIPEKAVRGVLNKSSLVEK